MKYHRQYDWSPVVGEAVQIRNNGKVIRDGVVEAVTLDDSILWLAADGANSRQMVCKEEGDEVWIIYKWDTTGSFHSSTAPATSSVASSQPAKPFPSAESPTCLSASLTSSASA